MCLVKKPKVVTSAAAEAKEAPVLRNPYLDGLPSVLRARRGGVQSLTIRRGGASGTANAPQTAPTTPAPTTAPPKGSGLTAKQLALAPVLSQMPGALGLAGRALMKKAQL